MLANDKIELKLNKVVSRVEGDGIMKQVILQDVNTKSEEILEVEGLFVSIGLVAAAEFLEGDRFGGWLYNYDDICELRWRESLRLVIFGQKVTPGSDCSW